MLFWKIRMKARLKSADPQQRKEAVGMLAAAKRWETIAPLVNALGDKDAGVRQAAAAALLDLHLPVPVVAALKALPADANAELRQAAEEVLARITGRCLVGRFSRFDLAFRDSATLLAEMGDERAVQPLISILEEGDFGDRHTAANALGKLREKAKAAVPALTQALLDKHSMVVEAAAVALSHIAGRDEAALLLLWASEQRKLGGHKPLL